MDSDSASKSTSELEALMRPGVLSQAGFLGPHEHLDEVLAHDAQTMAELGLTYEKIAEKLEQLLTAAEKARSHAAEIGNLKVVVQVYPGFQMCPWSSDIHSHQCTTGGGVQFGSLDWSIINKRTGDAMRGSGLAVHLIRDHHFFEGFESPYRIDPLKIARVLELV
ncbi:hypothetical protein EH223_16000 [candidate division KSB1 bacterium]|nr:hypothetical protein [candidate division KSB1 bacterium]RQW01198.1 MAG: hypothetical protein EH223_16000 [candidate division KSB1 bacterium]